MVPWTVEFLKAPAAFVLKSNSTTEFKYKITSMKIFVRRIKLKPSFKLDLEKSLLKEPAIYPITSAYVNPLFIDANLKSVTFQDIFGGRSLPSFVACAFVRQDYYRGSYSGSPYQFDHFSLTSIKISVEDESYSYTPNFTSAKSSDWTRAYLGLFSSKLKIDHGSAITYDTFKNKGFAIYCFDMGSEVSLSNDHTTLKRVGANARLDIAFDSTSTNEAICCVLYCEHQNERVLIDGNRRVVKDYY